METIKLKTVLLSLIGVCMITCCSDSKDEIDEQFIQTAHIIKGKVEKGPLVRGSAVEMRTLDKDMSPTGNSYSAQIENNAGEFNYGSLKINSPYAKLTADGYFFNEVDGELSTGTIKLDAIVDLSDNQTINVNVLTHLKSQRIVYLVTSKGKTYKEANEQAQSELLAVFGLQEYSTKDASQFSIIGGDDAAGALIAVSSLVLSDRSEAQIVEYLSKLANEFSLTGTFSENTKSELKQTRNYLNGRLNHIAENIINRYNELGYNVTVKDLAYFFDWDDNGIAGDEIGDDVTLDKSEINAPSEGGDFIITVLSGGQLSFTPPSTTPGSYVTEDNFFSGLYEGAATLPGMNSTETIENKTIKIHIEPAQFKKRQEKSVSIYDARGNVAATITISQEGNPNINVSIPKLGDNGKGAVASAYSYAASAFNLRNSLEKQYATTLNPFNSSTPDISSAWSKCWQAINVLLLIKQADANDLACYQEYTNTHLALLYFTMCSYWGDLPFKMQASNSMDDMYISRTSQTEILKKLEELLVEAIPVLEEKKNNCFVDANSLFFVSKDVARVILANVYVLQKNYDKAEEQLNKVISNGYYSIANSQTISYLNNSECIIGGIYATRTVSEGENIIPILDYKEVLLTAAECYYHLGKSSKAKAISDELCTKKSLSISGTNELERIAKIRYEIQSPYYLPFIRRNSLGSSMLGLSSSQLYQLLWPIPMNELVRNPSMTQNPGY